MTMRELDELGRRLNIPCLHLIARNPSTWFCLFDQVMATNPDLNELFHGYTPLEQAIFWGSLDVARAFVRAGANPSVGKNLIHHALNSHAGNRYDAVKYAIELCPGNINSGAWVCNTSPDVNSRESTCNISPLQLAVNALVGSDIIRLLLEHGSDPNAPYTYPSGPPSSILYTIGDTVMTLSKCRLKILRLVIAYGGRYTEWELFCSRRRPGVPIINAVEQCRSVARVVLGLRHMGGRVMGNGRDALRLVAKEVWLSRMDEEWEAR